MRLASCEMSGTLGWWGGSVQSGTHTGRPDVEVEEALEGGKKHDGHHHDLSLRHVDGAEGEGARYVGLPVSAVEQGGGTQTLRQEEVREGWGGQLLQSYLEQHPARVETQPDCTAAGDADKDGADAVTAVVKQLPQRAARLGSPGLFPVNGVQGLIYEEPQGAGECCPPGSYLGGWGTVEDQDQGGEDVDGEARHCDQVGSHP